MEKTWKLEELASEAGVAPRTVRYYVQRGLLPAPAFRGKDTVYTGDHLARLRAIRRMQERFLPLDVIQTELAGKSADEIETVEAAPRPPPAPAPAWEASRWTRFVLEPGLEIHVSEGNAGARARAEELRAHYEKGMK